MTIDAAAIGPEPIVGEESAPEPIDATAPDQLAFVDDDAAEAEGEAADIDEPETTDEPEVEVEVDTDEAQDTIDDPRCAAYAAVWVQAEAFVALRSSEIPNVGAIASSLLASALTESRSTVGQDLVAMADALGELDALVADEFHHDWAAFATSETVAEHPAEVAFETERDKVALFISDECPGIDIAELADAASDATRTLDQNLRRLSVPVEPSESIDGFSTYERSSGRFEVSFPAEWQRFEIQYGSLVEFVASDDPDAFLDGEPVDGVHVRVVRMFEAVEIDALIAATRAATECTALETEPATNAESGALARRTYDCGDHDIAVFAGFDEIRRTGIIVEATYDGPESSGVEVIDQIADSLTWGSIPG